MIGTQDAAVRPQPPLWLLAELTYRCPLHCVFCYNPVDFGQTTVQDELATAEWVKVLREARALGSVQLGLSGGEPLMRDDLEDILAEAHTLGYYTNLITSGVGLNEKRVRAFKASGLDHIQLSFQDSTREINDFLSGTRTFEIKTKVARLIKDQGYPMVMNVVLHRLNIDHVGKLIEMAVSMGAEYLELANSQYYSWAHLNRAHLLPSHEQIRLAEEVVRQWRERLGDKLRIFFVVPDYHGSRPKKCMNGWGNVFLTVTPDGTALPCHTAKMLPGLTFPNVRSSKVDEIWYRSEAFNAYRGDGWMKEPCRSCPEKEVDLGGCRCQAFLLTKDAANADPVCDRSPYRSLVDRAVNDADSGVKPEAPLVFRRWPERSGQGEAT